MVQVENSTDNFDGGSTPEGYGSQRNGSGHLQQTEQRQVAAIMLANVLRMGALADREQLNSRNGHWFRCATTGKSVERYQRYEKDMEGKKKKGLRSAHLY